MAEVNINKNEASTKCAGTTDQQMVSTEFTWTIRNFSLSPEQQGEYIISPSFYSDQLTDMVWRLRLYPVGDEHWGFVALKLQLVSCGEEEYVYASCKFANIDVHGKENFVHEEKLQKFVPESLIGPSRFCAKVQALFCKEGEQGRKQFSRVGVIEKRSQMLHGDDLVIRCTVNAIGRLKLLPINMLGPPADEEISAHLCNLLESGSLSDFTITVGAVKYPVHKTILAARSSFFLAMLEADNGEAAEIEGMSPETVYEMLKYIYTGKVEHLEGKAEDLLRLAQRYRLGGLKARCEKALSRILSLENAVHFLVFADDQVALELKNNVIRLIRIHAKEVCRTEEWKSMVSKKPHLVEEVLQALVGSEFRLINEITVSECGQKSES